MSGSVDLFRNLIGGFYTTIETVEGESLQWVHASPRCNPYSLTDNPLRQALIGEDSVVKRGSNEDFFPSKYIPISVASKYDSFVSDEEWKTFVMGGSFADKVYPGIYAPNTFDINNIDFQITYDLLEAKLLTADSYTSYSTHTDNYDYLRYLHDYQNLKPTSMLHLPNIYYIVGPSDREKQKTQIKDFVYLENQLADGYCDIAPPPAGTLWDGTWFPYPPIRELQPDETGVITEDSPGLVEYKDLYHISRDYYQLYTETNISASTADYLNQNTSTLIFNVAAMERLLPLGHEYIEYTPYTMNLHIPYMAGGGLVNSIYYAGFSDVLLREIGRKFIGEREKQSSFRFMNETVKDVLGEYDYPVSQTETKESTLVGCDLLEILKNYSNSGIPENQAFGCHFLGEQSLSVRAAVDTAGHLRYLNKTAADAAIDALRGNFLADPLLNPVASPSLGDAATTIATGADQTAFELKDLWDLGRFSRPAEVFAWRIQKIDNETGEVQNIIIENRQPTGIEAANPGSGEAEYDPSGTVTTNTPEGPTLGGSPPEDWVYHDTQVEYGKNYTYSYYGYLTVPGLKYTYRDITISRVINPKELETMGIAHVDACIEFYDPYTGAAKASPAYDGIPHLLDFVGGTADSREPINTTYSTDAQEITRGDTEGIPYDRWADFAIELQPTFKLIEVPLGGKMLSLRDNPPRRVEVIPYQRKDSSQIIGFYAKMESFVATPYSTVYIPENIQIKTAYLGSNNLLPTENVPNEAVTKPRYVEVYRLSKEPSSMMDFDGALVATKDLKLEGQTEYPEVHGATDISSCCFYEEKISTNSKFYYTFRFVSELGMPGSFTPVQVAELIDDGGYKYAKFSVINKQDLSDDITYDSPITPFRKLIKFVPHLHHLNLNDENVDYEEPAHTQLSNFVVGDEARESLWDKVFKIRLTSKKTGKKIDLNVTYKLKEES